MESFNAPTTAPLQCALKRLYIRRGVNEYGVDLESNQPRTRLGESNDLISLLLPGCQHFLSLRGPHHGRRCQVTTKWGYWVLTVD